MQLVLIGNRGVSLYFPVHRAPSEAEEALSFPRALPPWLWVLLALRSISLPSPLPLWSISKNLGLAGTRPPRHRAAIFSNPVLARRGPSSLRPSYWFPPLPLFASAPAELTLFPLFFFSPLSSAGMEASWRQVAGGRGRARGRATAAPSSGNGIHLRGAGGGREKGAAGPGPSPRGAATPAAAGSSARRSPAGPEALQTSVACGERGSCPRFHLGTY